MQWWWLVADSRWREGGELSTWDRVDYRRLMGYDGLGGSRSRGRRCSMDGYWWLDCWSSNVSNGNGTEINRWWMRWWAEAKGMWLGNTRKAVVVACDHGGRIADV
ncbi:hypothetical protein L6452_21586 [Arctium lappa]|uniref:Uncharacterized protein n=1 Tax=Arctium lappa TaxID=4217 RepID=A0ACB9AXS8_ARCLA|nr:hypothetical protein L6452_21586 [Arctium lappa]